MRTQVFDDGSSLTFDDYNNVVSGTDSNGSPVAVPPPGGSPIVQQFVNLFTYGIRSAIDEAAAKNRAQTAAVTAAGASPLAGASQYLPVLILAGLGIAAYKAVSK